MESTDGGNDFKHSVKIGTLSEKKDERFWEERQDADDDVNKSRMQFPDKLYGRVKELKQLKKVYSSFGKFGGCRAVFLSGYSGTGKTVLVDEFTKRVIRCQREDKHNRYICGEYADLKVNAGDPFAAIGRAMNKFVLHLARTCIPIDLLPLKKRLAKLHISLGSFDAAVLTETVMPGLLTLLEKASTESVPNETREEKMKRTSSYFREKCKTYDGDVVKYALQNFFKAAATERHPITLFMDDLQCADLDSLRVLLTLLKDESLHYVMFIGAYQPDVLNDPLERMIKEVQRHQGPQNSFLLKIDNLVPHDVTLYIADAMSRTPEDVTPISEAVYSKTLGNIFSVKQAMEELVRQNAINYDVGCSQWTFSQSKTCVELEDYLQSDVLKMVQSKLKTLPSLLQMALSLGAYTDSTFDSNLLTALMAAERVLMDSGRMQKMMKSAAAKGLVLEQNDNYSSLEGSRHNRMISYKFAHDRIRQAARAMVPKNELHNFLLRLSLVLLDLGSLEENNWMLFVAAQHLNSLPSHIIDPVQLIQLNLKVGKIAASKGAFGEAAVLLRVAQDKLDLSVFLKDHYNLWLDVKNNLMEVEHSLGNEDAVLAICREIFQNAKTLPETSRAQIVYIHDFNRKNKMDCAKYTDVALEILKTMYSLDDIPGWPKENQVKAEKRKLRMRSWSCVDSFPPTTDQAFISQVRVVSVALLFAMMGNRFQLADFLGYRILQIIVSRKEITEDIPLVFAVLGANLRLEEDFKGANAFADIGMGLLKRWTNERGVDFFRANMAIFTMLEVNTSPVKVIDTNMELNRVLLSRGEKVLGILPGICAMIGYFNASLQLDSLFESRLSLLEGMSDSLGERSSASVFGLLRQCLYNLRGGTNASHSPVEVRGAAFDEKNVQLEADAQKQIFTDVSTFRLMLAVIFNNEHGMEQMLDRLAETPIFDIFVERQYLRATYVGLAALLLSKKKSSQCKKLAKGSLNIFGKLSKLGSTQGRAVYACLKAVEKPAVKAFDEAIQVCGDEGLLNLTALMNEHCGLMLLAGEKRDVAAEYLKSALWLYHDWGAEGKVQQLSTKYKCLQSALNQEAPSKISSIRMKSTRIQMSHYTQGITDMKTMLSVFEGDEGPP